MLHSHCSEGIEYISITAALTEFLAVRNSVFVHTATKKVDRTEPQNSVPGNQQQGAFPSQSQDRGMGVIVLVVALAMRLDQLGDVGGNFWGRCAFVLLLSPNINNIIVGYHL